MEEYIDRINEVIKWVGVSKRQFCISIDCPTSTLNTFLLGKRDSLDVSILKNILVAYESINPSWLLLGKGEMILKKDNFEKSSNNEQVQYSELLTCQMEMIKQQNILIKEMNEQIRLNKAETFTPDNAQEEDSVGCAGASNW